MTTNWTYLLQHRTPVAVLASNSHAIQIFEQRDGVLSRHTRQLLEAWNIEGLATQLAYLRAECVKHISMDIHLVLAHLHKDLVAQQQSHKSAHLRICEIELRRDIRKRGSCQAC